MQLEKIPEKIDYLTQIQELIFANDLLDNFLDEVIGFQNDRSFELRRFVVGFIEASCKKDADNFGKLLVNLNYLLNDSNTSVSKKCIQTANQLCRDFFLWVSRSRLDEQLQSTYESWMLIKHFIFDAFDSTENDGIRTHCIKFMETIVVLQTPAEPGNGPSSSQDTLDVDFQTLTNCTVLKADNIEQEAEQVFDQLVQFYESPHISSVNLMALMQSLVGIAKKRTTKFLEKVIVSMRRLSTNLPPTLAKSQVSSVEKQLKLQMLMLLKHPHIIEQSRYQTPIVELLFELGANQTDIGKCFQEARKRGVKVEPMEVIEAKRIKLESNVNHEPITLPLNKPSTSIKPPETKPAIDLSTLKVTRSDANQALSITSDFLNTKFSSVENVCDLVLVSLLSVPDSAPDHFEGAYKSIGEPGTRAYITALCKQLSNQFTLAGLGRHFFRSFYMWKYNYNLTFICSHLFIV
jgi:symplekin